MLAHRFRNFSQLVVLEREKENEKRRGWKMEVFERVREIIVDILGVEPEKVTLEASFREDLEADSLDLVELSWHLRRSSAARYRTKRRRR